MKKQRLQTALNALIIAAILILNYFYQRNGFDFTLKCVCSGGFALLGLINLGFACARKQGSLRFHISMALGLVLAMLGDVLIGYNFILGAGIFALGHVCFAAAYCFEQRFSRLDLGLSAVLFIGAAAFLVFCPLLRFEVPAFRIVCLAYALIISTMLGKAAGNFLHSRKLLTAVTAIASTLFFFSDLMLVFSWFIGLWDWTDHACMGTYYPALCMLALAMYLKSTDRFERN